MSSSTANLPHGVVVPTARAPAKVEVAVVEVAAKAFTYNGLVEVETKLVPSKKIKELAVKEALLVPPRETVSVPVVSDKAILSVEVANKVYPEELLPTKSCPKTGEEVKPVPP